MKITYQMKTAISEAAMMLFNSGHEVQTEKWQGLEKPPPMLEILNHSFSTHIPPTPALLQLESQANQPWAEDHFLERVGGQPVNPGVQYKNWPFYKGKPEADIHRTENEQFTHSYMERLWCTKTSVNKHDDHFGIRYPWGDMADVVTLLDREPFTRQAFLPIWFPEDTGVKHGGRVPCTIGYHFIRRANWLHCVYYIRSCDFFRHFRDDVYLASRKVQWLIDKLAWSGVTPGTLTMHITSLHCWANERQLLMNHYGRTKNT